jgi:hypothetical protein
MIPNWYVPDTEIDTGTGGTGQFTAAIEYPSGTFTQLLFSGVAQGNVADGATLTSDLLTIAIPINTQFWVRIFANNNFGIVFQNSSYTGAVLSSGPTFGDQVEFSATSLTDKTLGGAIADCSASLAFRPAAIIGPTTKASVVVFGDSISSGITDVLNSAGDGGAVERWLGANFGYSNMSKPGGTIQNFVSGTKSQRRRELIPFATHAIFALSNNDIWQNNRTSAQLEADWATGWAFVTSQSTNGVAKAAFQMTTMPRTTSTDAWATTVNQTVTNSTNSATRLTTNTHLRSASLAGITGYFEMAYPIESSNDSNLWNAPNYTKDGTHPDLTTGYLPIDTLNRPLALTAIHR